MNEEVKTNVLGTFEGKCADATVTNENGLDITREVWEHLFKSEDYKTGIQNGWYLGCLGHPDDPCDQNHKDACIVMRDCWITDSGEVEGKFDLIDTPVGRIVKTFIDVGVIFGLSVRGAGDIYNNSVDPDTFCFRGFDLVIFPAYKDAIPKFTQIAASTDVNDRMKYHKICASVKAELDTIDNAESLNIIQTQFPANSEVYSEIEDKKQDILNSDDNICNDNKDLTDDGYSQFLEDKVSHVVDLYVSKCAQLQDYKKQLEDLTCKLSKTNAELVELNARFDSIERIHKDTENSYIECKKSYEKDKRDILATNHILKSNNYKLRKAIELKDTKIAKISNLNLNLNQKITSTKNLISEKDSIIASLRSDVTETVKKSKLNEQKLSNCDEDILELKKDLNSALKVIEGYQDEYMKLYSSLVCNSPTDLSIDAMTDVKELKKMIDSATNSYNVHCNPKIDEEFVISDDNMVTV